MKEVKIEITSTEVGLDSEKILSNQAKILEELSKLNQVVEPEIPELPEIPEPVEPVDPVPPIIETPEPEQPEPEVPTLPEIPSDKNYLTLEHFGGKPYYKRMTNKLKYTSLKNGTTKITFIGNGIFDSEDLGKRFCGVKANKNPSYTNPDNVNEYYPNAITSRYCNVIEVVDPKNIIVDFEFNLNQDLGTGYIFHDNSKAFSDVIEAFENGDFDHIYLEEGKTYVVPETHKHTLTKTIRFVSKSQKSRLKIGYEDYFQWGNGVKKVAQQGRWFDLGTGDNGFISYNIDWIPPHNQIPQVQCFNSGFFSGANISNNTKMIAIINCNMLAEKEEYDAAGIDGFNFIAHNIGSAYSGGKIKGEGVSQEISEYMYVFLKNFKSQKVTLTDFKANSGGGLYWVNDNVITDNSKSSGHKAIWYKAKIRFTDDWSGLKVNNKNYPSHVAELTSDNTWYQIANMYTNSGWGNAGNTIQIGGYVFWQPVSTFWSRTYDQWYGGNHKWEITDSGCDNFNGGKMMMLSIPRKGKTYTIGRSYTISNNRVGEYIKNRVRGNINWSAVLNKPSNQISNKNIPSNCTPLVFQPKDKLKINGEIYEVIRTDRLDYPHWENEIKHWGGSAPYYAFDYWLDRDLPDNLPMTFEVEIIHSGAEELLDGKERDAYISYKANSKLRAGDIFMPGYYVRNHDTETTMEHGNILGHEDFGHAIYNHEEITFWAKNMIIKGGDYRESSNNGRGFDKYVVDGREVYPLANYSNGYVMINCSGFVRQFDPVNQFKIKASIRKSLGLDSRDDDAVKLVNCSNLNGIENSSSEYVKKYNSESEVPSMPKECSNLLDDLKKYD